MTVAHRVPTVAAAVKQDRAPECVRVSRPMGTRTRDAVAAANPTTDTQCCPDSLPAAVTLVAQNDAREDRRAACAGCVSGGRPVASTRTSPTRSASHG